MLREVGHKLQDKFYTIICSFKRYGLLTTAETQANNQKQYSLPNLHGDTLLTTNALGANTSNGAGPASTFVYDPFGNPIQGSILPANTSGGSYGYVGQHQKMTETNLALQPIQMGARVYLPQLGRFAQVDPIEGGTENNYVYPADPVNEFDLTGEASKKKKVVGFMTYSSLKPSKAQKAAFEFYCGRGKEALTCFIPGINAIKVGKAGIKAVKLAKQAQQIKKAQASWKKLDRNMVKKLEKQGHIRTHGRGSDKLGGSKQDIFVDKKTGELYAKPKNGTGPGEPIGVNIRELKK